MATAPISNSSLPVAGSTSAAGPAGRMGKDDFMKLLVAQLKHQDPTSPTDMNGMTAQMTQFSMLEQMTNLSKSGEETATSLARTEALALLGKTVSYLDQDKVTRTGTVEHVDVSATNPTLTVAGRPGVLPATLTGVR